MFQFYRARIEFKDKLAQKRNLSLAAQVIFSDIERLTDGRNKKGVQISHATLAKRNNISISTVKKALKELDPHWMDLLLGRAKSIISQSNNGSHNAYTYKITYNFKRLKDRGPEKFAPNKESELINSDITWEKILNDLRSKPNTKQSNKADFLFYRARTEFRDRVVQELRLSLAAQVVFSSLERLLHNKNLAQIPYELLATQNNTTTKTVARAITELTTKGLIKTLTLKKGEAYAYCICYDFEKNKDRGPEKFAPNKESELINSDSDPYKSKILLETFNLCGLDKIGFTQKHFLKILDSGVSSKQKIQRSIQAYKTSIDFGTAKPRKTHIALLIGVLRQGKEWRCPIAVKRLDSSSPASQKQSSEKKRLLAKLTPRKMQVAWLLHANHEDYFSKAQSRYLLWEKEVGNIYDNNPQGKEGFLWHLAKQIFIEKEPEAHIKISPMQVALYKK